MKNGWLKTASDTNGALVKPVRLLGCRLKRYSRDDMVFYTGDVCDAFHVVISYQLRSKTNRALPSRGKLWDSVTKDAPLGEILFTLPKSREHKTRDCGGEHGGSPCGLG